MRDRRIVGMIMRAERLLLGSSGYGRRFVDARALDDHGAGSARCRCPAPPSTPFTAARRAALADLAVGAESEELQHAHDRRGVEAAQRRRRRLAHLAEQRAAQIDRAVPRRSRTIAREPG